MGTVPAGGGDRPKRADRHPFPPQRHLRRGADPRLTLPGVATIPAVLLHGLVGPGNLWLAALLMPLYMAGTWTGQALFTPGRERFYRGAAHAVIVLAMLVGLPLWD